MLKSKISIFEEYYTPQPITDRYAHDPVSALTVIIPVIHTNELWEQNLISIYREIPVAELLIADGGCVDNSLEVAKKFPRVRILNHHQYKSLGYSIRLMIEEVKTEWFAYLHSDVYLPIGWFDQMKRYQGTYDWYGCRMQHTLMVEYDLDYGERPYAGAQLGKRKVFEQHVSRVDDDYVYRQEDFVFSDIVKRGGGIEGRIDDVFHYHQTMHKVSPTGRKITGVRISVEMNDAEKVRSAEQQLKGIVKYLKPNSPWLINSAIASFDQLTTHGMIRESELISWIKTTDSQWWPIIRSGVFKTRFKRRLINIQNWFKPFFRF